MANDNFTWDDFQRTPIIGILRGWPPEVCLRVAECARQAGITTLEITVGSPHVLATITRLRDRFPELNIGAGTVSTPPEYTAVRGAGAQFIVSPIVAEEVVAAGVRDGLPCFPGAFTPTEIFRAHTLGATAVKVFPARTLGASFVRDVRGPLPSVNLVPTGGVTVDNLSEFFAAGAVGVGMGGGLFPKKLLTTGDWAALSGHIQTVADRVHTAVRVMPT